MASVQINTPYIVHVGGEHDSHRCSGAWHGRSMTGSRTDAAHNTYILIIRNIKEL